MVARFLGRRLALGIASSVLSMALPTIAFAAPPSPPATPNLVNASDTGASNSDEITNDTTPTFTVGSCANGNTIKLYDGVTVLGSALCSGGSATVTSSALADGVYTIKATETSGGGESNKSGGLSVTIDTAAPGTTGAPNMTNASDLGDSNSDDITSDNTPSFTVSCTTGMTVNLYKGATLLDSATCAGSNANLTSSTLADGVSNIKATQSDTAGNESGLSTALSIVIDTSEAAPGTPDLKASSDTGDSNTDDETADDTPTFTMSCTTGDTVELRNSNTTVASGTCVGGTINLTSSALSDGTKTIRARQLDVAGNTSANSSNLSVTIDTSAPGAPSTPDLDAASDSGSSSTDNITSDTTPTFTLAGCTNGNTIHLFNGVTELGSVLCGPGTETVTSSALADGVYFLTAKESDVSGNMSGASSSLSVTIDTAEVVTGTPDLQAGSDTGSSSTDNITTDATPTVTISCATGTTVSLYNGVTSLGVDTCVASSATITSSTLVEGSYSLTAKQVDAAGNQSVASSGLSITIDLTAPVTILLGGTPVNSYLGQAYVDAGATASDSFDGDLTVNIVLGGSVNINVLGPNMLTYNVSDAAGNAALQVSRIVNVIQSTTTTAVVSDANPSVYGDVVTFTATVTGFSPTGTVSFYDGITLLGTDALDGSFEATYSTGALLVGSHNITAVYAGDISNLTSTSSTVVQDVTQKSITVTPTAGQSKVYGDADPAFAYSNDTLSFSDTMTGSLARVAGENVGTYDITIGTLTAGANYTLTLDPETFAITQLATVSSTVLDTPTPNSLVGSGVILKATVTGVNPTGTVEFYSGSLLVGSTTLLGDTTISNGSGSITYTFTYAGSYSLTAKYLGDANHLGSFSANPLTVHVVDKDAADTVTTMSSSGSSLVGSGVTLTATVAGAYYPTGTVTFYDGAVLIGTGSLNGSFEATINYTFTAAGNHDITAHYLGDSNNNASISAVEEIFVQEVRKDSADTVTTISSSGSSLVGTGVTLTATVTGAYNPTGTVEFYDGASLIGSATLDGSFQASLVYTFTAAGMHNITSHYLGDSNNNVSVSAVELIFVQQVRKDTPDTVTTMSSSGSSLVGTGVTLVATVSGAYMPTGTVEFYDDVTLIGTGSLSITFEATLDHVFTLAGTHNLTAHYLGDDNNNASVSAIEPILVQEVRKDSPDTATVLSVANPSTIGDILTFTADVTGGFNPSGNVLFKDGGVMIGSGTLVSGTATFSTDQLAVGSHDITAEYEGDVNNNPSVSPVVTVQIVQKKTSTTILADLPVELNGPAQLTFNVTVNGFFPTGTVAIWDGGSFLLNVTLSNGSGSFTQIFTGDDFSHTFHAVYPGDVNNTSSISGEKTVNITLGADSEKDQGAAANRGNNLSRALSIVRFAANLHLGDLPPGSFGGADAPLAGSEKEYVCSIQRSLPSNFNSAYIKVIATIMSQYTGRDVDVIAQWLRDPSLCADITVSRLGFTQIAQAELKPFYITSEGFPVSQNPTWNKCVTGKFTYEDIQSNPDRSRKGTPKSCADYHTGSNWYHPDLHLFFDWNLGTKKVTLPNGYVLKKDEAVSVR